MNKKVIGGSELRCEFARGEKKSYQNNNNFRGGDRGGDRGDRGDRNGGFRGRDDRGPRRDFGDRPKGCFNCQE